jgi:hypothetical protein
MAKEVTFPSPTLHNRYWSHVDRRQPDECWPWTAFSDKVGYGKIWVGYDADGKAITQYAHRVGWEFAHGDSPGDLHIRHRCDNPTCQNPNHWELGTHLDNMRDMVERKRVKTMYGEKHGKSKLSTQQVNEIIDLYDAGHTQCAIARTYGVTQQNISYIVRGVTRSSG